MNIIIWNCRGFSNKGFATMIKDISWWYQTKFICLLEMHVGRARAGRIIKKFGLTDCFFEDGVGFSGGIWCMWRKDHWKVKDERNHRQFVHLEVAFENEPPWFLMLPSGLKNLRGG